MAVLMEPYCVAREYMQRLMGLQARPVTPKLIGNWSAMGTQELPRGNFGGCAQGSPRFLADRFGSIKV